MTPDTIVDELETCFEEFKNLAKQVPTPPADWTPPRNGEIGLRKLFRCHVDKHGNPDEDGEKTVGEVAGVYEYTKKGWSLVDGQDIPVEKTAPVSGEGGLRRRDGAKWFVWTGGHLGKWSWLRPAESVKLEIRQKAVRRIAEILACIDERSFGKSPDELQLAYNILCVMSEGLGYMHSTQVASADALFTFMDSVVTSPMHWATIWMRSCQYVGDRESFVNLADGLTEQGGGSFGQKHALTYSQARGLHGDLYLGKAMVAALDMNDPDETRKFLRLAMTKCAGNKGIVRAARLMSNANDIAVALIEGEDGHEPMDEEDAYKEAFKHADVAVPLLAAGVTKKDVRLALVQGKAKGGVAGLLGVRPKGKDAA